MNGSGKTQPMNKGGRMIKMDQGLFVPGLWFTKAEIGKLTQ